MITVDDVAALLAVDRDDARGLIRFLRAKDLIVPRGKRPNTGRGRGADVYDFPHDIAARAANALEPLRGR